MKTISQVTTIVCDLCRESREEFEVEEIHTEDGGISFTVNICRHCILELKRQLSLFNLTFSVRCGKGHFNSWGDTATFYIKGNRM